MKSLILNMKETESILTVKNTIEAVESAFRSFSDGKVYQPPITSIHVEEHNGEMDFKSGYSSDKNIIGMKMAGGFWDNPSKFQLPSGLGVICLFDGTNGYPLSVMDATLVTAYRTAAAGVIASKCLARNNSETIGVIGTGQQARSQVSFHISEFNIKKVYVWGIDGLDEYISKMSKKFPDVNFIKCDSAKSAVENADIIITVTASKSAIVMNEWIKEGTHINAIGADMQGKQEIDANIFGRALVVNDNIKECTTRGETQHSINQGIINEADIHAEIGEILNGKKSGRTCDDEITIFDATGMSIQDIETGYMVYKEAKLKDIGAAIQIL